MGMPILAFVPLDLKELTVKLRVRIKIVKSVEINVLKGLKEEDIIIMGKNEKKKKKDVDKMTCLTTSH